MATYRYIFFFCSSALILSWARNHVSAKNLLTDLATAGLPHSAMLDVDENYHLSWDFDDEKIVFEAQVKTLGYVGLGISPNGDMEGADIVTGGVDNGGVYLTDRHATGRKTPPVDETQNWKVLKGSQNDTHTTLRFWRSLDTCDTDDRIIKADTMRVIWAYREVDWAPGTSMYHGNIRGTKSIFLLNQQKKHPEIPKESVTVEFLNGEVTVPAEDTVYWCQSFSTHHFQRKHHAIKFEPVIQPGNEGFVHHMVLYACAPEVTNQTAGQNGICYSSMPVDWDNCPTSIYAWAIGAGDFYLPEHVGYPFGSDGDPKLLLLQTHYDNPEKRAGLVDSSGFRVTFTPRLRENEAGTLVVGVSVWKTQIIPPYEQDFISRGHCVPECLEQAMPSGSTIKAFAGFLHAHFLGSAIIFRHFRKGVEQRPIIQDENYDFHFQETRMLEEEVEIRHGDHLITECHYNSINRKSVTFGGFRSRDEMCETFIMYYPRIQLANCYSGVDLTTLADIANVTFYPNATVSSPDSLQGQHLGDVMNLTINWSDEHTRALFQEETTSLAHPVRTVCLRDRSLRYDIDRKLVRIPKMEKVYVPSDSCSQPSKATAMSAGYIIILTSTLAVCGFHN